MFEWINDNRYTCILLMVLQGIVKRQTWRYDSDGWSLIENERLAARSIWPAWMILAECRWWNSWLGCRVRAWCGTKQREYRLHQLQRREYWQEAYYTAVEDLRKQMNI